MDVFVALVMAIALMFSLEILMWCVALNRLHKILSLFNETQTKAETPSKYDVENEHHPDSAIRDTILR